MKRIIILLLLLLSIPVLIFSQTVGNQNNNSPFQSAYQACPDVPQGLLEAVSFTNTHCNHLTDDNYYHDGPDAMPRAYGMMGLVRDGKGYFRENLHLVSALSGISEEEILDSPDKNVLAYAKAFSHLAKETKASDFQDYLSVIRQLSELPIGERIDDYPMQSMLYSVCVFLNDAKRAETYGFPKYDIDLKSVFAEHYDLLAAPELGITRSPDYPPAIWDPAPECNWEERTKEVSGVVIHYTEGSYAGCISWFKNCESSVSAHYVIRSVDGQVTQMVREKDKAWHARTANEWNYLLHKRSGNRFMLVSVLVPCIYNNATYYTNIQGLLLFPDNFNYSGLGLTQATAANKIGFWPARINKVYGDDDYNPASGNYTVTWDDIMKLVLQQVHIS